MLSARHRHNATSQNSPLCPLQTALCMYDCSTVCVCLSTHWSNHIQYPVSVFSPHQQSANQRHSRAGLCGMPVGKMRVSWDGCMLNIYLTLRGFLFQHLVDFYQKCFVCEETGNSRSHQFRCGHRKHVVYFTLRHIPDSPYFCENDQGC